MLDVLFFIVALGIQPPGGNLEAQAPTAPEAVPTQTAEAQVPTGRFTTATEVKPILTATKSAWIATREWQGQDLVYVTHLWSWRCGLVEMRVTINDGPEQIWPMPVCHSDEPAPNAIKDSDGLPYAAFALGAVQRIAVTIVYDDLTRDSAVFDGNGLLLP